MENQNDIRPEVQMLTESELKVAGATFYVHERSKKPNLVVLREVALYFPQVDKGYCVIPASSQKLDRKEAEALYGFLKNIFENRDGKETDLSDI